MSFSQSTFGNHRFDNLTDSLSFPVAKNLKGCVECDGYDWNTLATYAPEDRVQAGLGFINRKCAFWSAVYRF